ncbi:hypothetical protein BDM02DRAFT_3272656 [Thelephora ganbajun]|uniref:Uncharacterized protein n=1 Tax=Thelephora ganbajun TaxID=370292 RepID=A0ACB6Z3L0_THEGA|nr:hypothetical protein BDM02DRAFT_3272656 [Thelephora ganbajun]
MSPGSSSTRSLHIQSLDLFLWSFEAPPSAKRSNHLCVVGIPHVFAATLHVPHGKPPFARGAYASDVSSDFTRLVLSDITTFRLRHVADSNATLSFSSLLDFLERSPLLERLYFSHCSCYDDAVSPRRIVALHYKGRLLYALEREIDDITNKRRPLPLTMTRVDAQKMERDVSDLLPKFKALRNILAPVNKLPPEILSQIPQFFPIRDLVVATQVCRYWRTTFISCGPLWCNINCERGPEALTCLHRSRSSPIHVRVRKFPNDEVLARLSPHIERIKTLHLQSRWSVAQSVFTRFTDPAPNLETLTVICRPSTAAVGPVPSTLLTGNLPKLRSLILIGFSSDLANFVLPNLTYFEMSNVTSTPLLMSLSNLLTFFERSPLLESVRVDFHGECVRDAPKHKIISLKALKTLYISGSGLVGHGDDSLLARLELPRGVDVTVMLLILDGSSNPIACAIPPHPDRLPFISGTKRVHAELLPGHGRYTFRFSGENGKVTVMARWPITNLNLGDLLMGSIQSFLPFSTEGAEELCIQGYQAPANLYLPAMRAFDSLPNLRSILMVHCDNTVLLRALRQPTRNLIVPELRTMKLYLDPQREVSGEDLMELVKCRASSGARMEELSIVSSEVIVPVAEVMALRPYVGLVEYKMDDSIPSFED